MKNYFIGFILGIFVTSALTSCDSYVLSELSDQEQHQIVENIKVRSDSKIAISDFSVTEEMAMRYAKSYKKDSEIISIQTVKKDENCALYVINFDEGWMVIPADMRLQPVVGEDETGHIDPETIENPGVKVWLDDMATTVSLIRENGIDKYEEENVMMWTAFQAYADLEKKQNHQLRDSDWVSSTWVKITNTTTSIISDVNTGHLLLTTWGQGSPWNCSLPIDPNAQYGDTTRFLTGCVSTAVAQLLYYFHNKTGTPNDLWHTIIPSINTVNYDGSYCLSLSKSNHTNYSSRWSQMHLSKDLPTPGDSSSIDFNGFRYVSNLMLDIGVRMNANYSISNTGIALNSASHLTPCGISCQKDYYDYDIVRSNLQNLKPVLIVAYQSGTNKGHAWIIDGCYDKTTSTVTTSTYYQFNPSVSYPPNSIFLSEDEVYGAYPNAYDGMQIVESTYNNSMNYLLMNYGWNGNYDSGHYSITSLDWALNYNTSKRIYYNISTGQLN